MPIDVSIDEKRHLVHRTVEGAVSMDEIIANLEKTLLHPDYRIGMKDLTDLRDYVHQSGSEDMRRLAQYIISRSNAAGDFKSALVVSETVTYGMLRMLQIQLDSLPSEIAIFYDLDEAERWLGIE